MAIPRKTVLILLFLVPFFGILYSILIRHVNSFGCFDDCSVFMAGYFMTKGKKLYSEIFFNHQLLMPYLSYFVQLITNPVNIPDLVLKHRMAVWLIFFIMDFLIIWRFKFKGLGFVIVYEIGKYYYFGDRFLAEAIIVYPIVYLASLLWEKNTGKVLSTADSLFAGLFAYLGIFLREPFTPLVLFLFIFILHKNTKKNILFSLIIFLSLSAITLLSVNLSDYYFNIVTVNVSTVANVKTVGNQVGGTGFLKTFFYPYFILTGKGGWNLFRNYLAGLSALFILLLFLLLTIARKWKLVLLIFLSLGLSNFRYVSPGDTFYATFHMLVWYGLLSLFIFLQLSLLKKYSAILFYGAVAVVFFLSGYFILSPKSYAWEKVDRHFEFMTNYGPVLMTGETIKALSNKNETLFLDGFDDLIYWQAQRYSSYPYSWYTSVMPGVEKYREAKISMFKKNPPDFYYGTCSMQLSNELPLFIRKDYIRLNQNNSPSCLYVLKNKIGGIKKEAWEKVKIFGYEKL